MVNESVYERVFEQVAHLLTVCLGFFVAAFLLLISIFFGRDDSSLTSFKIVNEISKKRMFCIRNYVINKLSPVFS